MVWCLQSYPMYVVCMVRSCGLPQSQAGFTCALHNQTPLPGPVQIMGSFSAQSGHSCPKWSLMYSWWQPTVVCSNSPMAHSTSQKSTWRTWASTVAQREMLVDWRGPKSGCKCMGQGQGHAQVGISFKGRESLQSAGPREACWTVNLLKAV